jgi:transcriptional regulator with XRE-family HTH domain
MPEFDLPGALRRIRRRADLSQRQLAEACGVSQSSVARAEAGRHSLTVDLLARAAAIADMRLALMDMAGEEVPPMSGEAVRDMAGRRFPAHLDTRYGDEDWWHGDERYARPQPWYTFDRLRDTRDQWRGRLGIPDDHQLPQPGDSPQARKAARQRAARRRQEEEWARRREAGELTPPEELECTCPPECDELDDRSGPPVHADVCQCRCDVG